MFGLSFGKLVVLIAVVLFVWLGWRKIATLVDAVKRQVEPPPPTRQKDATVDLVRNPRTGQYEPAKDD